MEIPAPHAVEPDVELYDRVRGLLDAVTVLATKDKPQLGSGDANQVGMSLFVQMAMRQGIAHAKGGEETMHVVIGAATGLGAIIGTLPPPLRLYALVMINNAISAGADVADKLGKKG